MLFLFQIKSNQNQIMKKIICTLSFILMLFSTQLFAQCTPDVSWLHSGIRPDSATGLPHACDSVLYTTQFDIYVPDTVHRAIPPSTTQVVIYIDSVLIFSFTGLPASMSYVSNPVNKKFVKFAHGCVQISGTPTFAEIGTHPLRVITKSYVKPLNFLTVIRYDTLDYYSIVVDQFGSSCVMGINEHLNPNQFDLLSTKPNPVNDAVEIAMNVPSTGKVEISIYNLIGKKEFTEMKMATAGYNTFQISDLNLATGIYLLTLQQGDKKVTRKLVVNK